jgi:hypothetical protein
VRNMQLTFFLSFDTHRSTDASGSPKGSDAFHQVAAYAESENESPPTSDSSILFKVTLQEMTLLVGRPLSMSNKATALGKGQTTRSHAVVQIVANSLVMFQSVENGDGSGSKTLHASVDNLSASANTAFFRLPPSKIAPMIGPTAAEFRIVYGTENLGSVMSQDIALDCEALKASLTPNDIFIIKSVVDRVMQRLQKFQADEQLHSLTDTNRKRKVLSSLIRYQKKGTGIATNIRFEIQRFSFVLLEAYRSKQGTRPLFEFCFDEFKGSFDGCMTALSGECSAVISINHFNFDLAEWESTMESVDIDLRLEQMPNELVSGHRSSVCETIVARRSHISSLCHR